MSQLSTRKDAIWAVYTAHGGSLSLRRLTQYCWEAGVWGTEAQRQMAFAAAKRECQRVLQSKDAAGCPVAGPTEHFDGAARIWRQLEIWDYADAKYNLGMRLRQVERDYTTIQAIWDYMQKRWRAAPPIPHLIYEEESGPWWLDPPEGEPSDPEDED